MLFGCLGPLTSVLTFARTATRGGRAGSAPAVAGVLLVVVCLVVPVVAASNAWLAG
jgi:hypothetical protein